MASRPRFTAQEKLALMMTSAGSMRNLAAFLGVSHQRVGRWLREGEPEHGGVRAIPAGAEPIIAQAFGIHCAVVREQNRHDQIPYIAAAPVYMERKPLSTGAMGDRVISFGTTEHIRQDLRMRFVREVVRTEKFHKVNIRSKVDLRRYFMKVVNDEPVYRRYKTRQREQGERVRRANTLLTAFVEQTSQARKQIIDKDEPFPLFTRDLHTTPGYVANEVAASVEQYLSEKHAPATGVPGTHFANEYLLQAFPIDYAKPSPRERKRKPRR